MRLGMFCLLDLAVEAHAAPFFARSNAEAARMVDQAASEKGSTLQLYPTQFELFRIGCFDTDTGQVVPETRLSLGLVLTLNTFAEKEDEGRN